MKWKSDVFIPITKKRVEELDRLTAMELSMMYTQMGIDWSSDYLKEQKEKEATMTSEQEKDRYDTVREKILIMEAWAEGKAIEFKFKNSGGWHIIFSGVPCWDFATYDYRVKYRIEPKTIPFTFDTAPFPIIIRMIGDETEFLTYHRSRIGMSVGFNGRCIGYCELADSYEYRTIDEDIITWKPCTTEVKP